MSHVSVRIDLACSQPWQAMPPTESGRFCDHCQKTVVDFSGLTDGELARLLAKQTGPACGRFRQSQLDRAIPVPAPISYSPGRWFSVVAAGLLGWQTVRAATPPIRMTVPAVMQPNRTDTFVPPADVDAVSPTDSLQELTGQVVDQDGLGIPGVTVSVRRRLGETTDAKGQFKLTVPAGLKGNPLTLIVSTIGYKTQEVNIASGQREPLFITLQEDTAMLGEVITVGGYRKLTFLERLRNRMRRSH